MIKFKTLRFSYLPNDAYYHYCEQVNKALDEAGAPVIDALGALPQQFAIWHVRVTAMINWIRKDKLTELIAEANKDRSRALVGMRMQTRALCYRAKPEINEAAERVIIMLDNYEYVYKKPYEAQNGSISAILRQLTDKYAADAKLLSLDEWIDELQTSCLKFNQLLDQRDTRSLQKPEWTFKEIRRNIENIYRQIVRLTDAGAALNILPDFAMFINKLNPEIERLNSEFNRARHNISYAEPAPIPPQTFTGEAITPTPDVYYLAADNQSLKLTLGKDYNISYRNNINPGNARCIIRGKGAYKGSKTVTFMIIINDEL